MHLVLFRAPHLATDTATFWWLIRPGIKNVT